MSQIINEYPELDIMKKNTNKGVQYIGLTLRSKLVRPRRSKNQLSSNFVLENNLHPKVDIPNQELIPIEQKSTDLNFELQDKSIVHSKISVPQTLKPRIQLSQLQATHIQSPQIQLSKKIPQTSKLS